MRHHDTFSVPGKESLRHKGNGQENCGKARCVPQHLPGGYEGKRITSFRRRCPLPRLKPRYLHHFGVAHAINNPSPQTVLCY